MEKIFDKYKPKDCRYCYFWKEKDKCCYLSGGENCFYVIPREEKPESECDKCPYRQIPCCTSLCMKKVLQEWKARRREIGARRW